MLNIKKNFPFLKKPTKLAYLDNASTTQICAQSDKACQEYNLKYKANVFRGNYKSSEIATEKYEEARKNIANLINSEPDEIIFTSGTTHGLNLLAYSLSPRLNHKDNIVLGRWEHHANLVPWQQMSRHYGFELRFIEITDSWQVDEKSINKVIDKNTKIVSFSLVSNVLGTISPAKKIIEAAKSVKATTVVDAAQAVAHLPIDVKNMSCDFLVFSGHKMYGPTGTGVLFGRKELLEESIEPFFFGGEMVESVSYNSSTWTSSPHKFEAGTPNISGVIGLGEAAKLLKKFGMKNVQKHEKSLIEYAVKKLSPYVRIFGPTHERVGVISFNLGDIHPHDLSEIIIRENIALRSGFHCAEPLHKLYSLNGSCRISLGIYNTKKDIDRLIKGIKNARKVFIYG